MENPSFGPPPLFESPGTIAAREEMVRNQILSRGISDEEVLRVMRSVPRHLFLPPEKRTLSYLDKAVPIGFGQTISQPYIVAYILEQLSLSRGDRVLEVGTGSGYLTALLLELGADLVSVEIVPELHRRARETLEIWKSNRTKNRILFCGDAFEFAGRKNRYVRLVSSACLPAVPGREHPFFLCLAEEGIAVLPISQKKGIQFLVTLKKRNDLWKESHRIPVQFVPLTGKGKDFGDEE